MEKENYATYEFMPASGTNTEAEPYQFFVVQDDGTFLINRQVQYVTQVQTDKEQTEGAPAQPCAMLDVAPQQFYVDVDNTGEMIVPEQFSIPEATSNLYAASYLLQPETAAPNEQIVNNPVEPMKTSSQDSSLPVTNKQCNNLTEITLSDEQYRLLEQKGWILLETNEKVYILDTYGLHDITTNDKLIQKLKEDTTTDNLEINPSELKIEYIPLDGIDIAIPQDERTEGKLETSETECDTDLSLIVDESNEGEANQKPRREKIEITLADMPQPTPADDVYKGDSDKCIDENVLRIRTDFSLKNIPDKLYLGKTVDGKRLVCKIVKPENKIAQFKKIEGQIQLPATAYETSGSIPTTLEDVGEEKLNRIFRMCFENSTLKYSSDDVAFVDMIVKQLLCLPAVKTSITNRNILITKVTVNETESCIIETSPMLVTGSVSSFNKEWRFVHKPDLYETAKQELARPTDADGIDHNFLHMHINEIQRDGKLVRTAVTLDKRRLELSSTEHSEKIFIPDLPLNALANHDPESTMYGYACGICAAIFQTETQLNDHRETHQMETDDKSSENAEETNFMQNGILVVYSDPSNPYHKTRSYACMQCKAKFQRLNNCQRHVKTHMAPIENEQSGDKKRVYKCKICYSFFHHAPTLLKHIMKSHINVENNTT